MSATNMDMRLYASRKLRNTVMMTLCVAAAGIGLMWLALILGTLLFEGVTGVELKVFTEMTPPPGDSGGLLNAIVGSLFMTVLGTLLGTPIGILAGTYMAEYGRNSKLTMFVRFINDILLSAPSIVIGLFVYTILVAPHIEFAIPMPGKLFGGAIEIELGGHFSGLAGAVALAIIVIPVVVRTTEDMLNLVPVHLREAASALGMPRSLVIRHVAYRAARAGIITGVLLAVARISGETAPLLFTALNNQFWSLELNHPLANLPVVIFQYAMSPYEEWQRLAWVGALLITTAVLLLSIIARTLGTQRSKNG